MSKITKTYLRKRWKDATFLQSLSIPLDNTITVQHLSNIDLRGVSKLGNGEPLWYFPSIISTKTSNLDISYGDGVLIIKNSEIEELKCQEFKFDRASFFMQSTFLNCIFYKAKIKFTATDTVFYNCDFSETTFKGGFNEYGFKRCKFYNCKFTSSDWQNIYFYACWFDQCDFTNFKVSNSLIRGFKVDVRINSIMEIFENCEIDGLKEEKLIQ